MIDWRKIIAELRAQGYDCPKLAVEAHRHGMETSADLLRALSCGRTKEPKYTLGVFLMMMHNDKCSNRS